MLRNLTLILISGASIVVSAADFQLPDLKPPEAPKTQIKESTTPIACGDLVKAFDNYRAMERAHIESVKGFTENFSQITDLWYTKLSPLEGTQQTIPVDTFAPIKAGSDRVFDLGNMVAENSETLSRELANLSEALRVCLADKK